MKKHTITTSMVVFACLLSGCSAASYTQTTDAAGNVATRVQVRHGTTVVVNPSTGIFCVDANRGPKNSCQLTPTE